LTKTDPSLTKILVGLGWDPRATDGAEFDLDASALLLAANGKVRGEADFIFYNQLKSVDGSVEHTGDNRTGAGDGDDEVIKVDLSRIPADVDKVVFIVTIHDAEVRKQSFGQVGGSFIRIVNDTTNAKSFVTTWQKTRRLKLRWCLLSCTATAASGNSALLARAMPAA
jgi:tellurium resistance protein TerD